MEIPEDVRKLVESSGNSFHAKVARWFDDNGWHVAISPYYMDQTQNKPREIDLIAERTLPVMTPNGQKIKDLGVRLFIECKYVSAYSALWFADKDREAARELVVAKGVFRRDNTYTDNHHYLSQSPQVAKLFATAGSRGPDTELFYRSLNQVLNGMVAKRGQRMTVRGCVPEKLRPSIELPVIVCNSFENLYGVSFYGEPDLRPISKPFQIEVRYAYTDRLDGFKEDYFLIDVINFDGLPEFSAAVDGDAKIAAFLAQG